MKEKRGHRARASEKKIIPLGPALAGPSSWNALILNPLPMLTSDTVGLWIVH